MIASAYTYLDQAGIAGDSKGPLFRTIGRGTALLTRTPLPQANAYEMIGRRPCRGDRDQGGSRPT